MTKKIALLLIFPLFVFGTIEVVPHQTQALKIENNLSQERTEGIIEKSTPAQPLKDSSDEDVKPEATTPPFLDSGYQKQFFKTLIFVAILLTFFLLVIYIYKRGAPINKLTSKNSKNNIKILERRALSPQTYLYHIQVGDKQFILSESKIDTRHITTLDWPDRK